jgi:hypothetical protein
MPLPTDSTQAVDEPSQCAYCGDSIPFRKRGSTFEDQPVHPWCRVQAAERARINAGATPRRRK